MRTDQDQDKAQATVPPRRATAGYAIIFLVAAAAALAFALSTRHVWEDYYITYRSSKNLATGHGLVFNVGDRLHTFTSPLGVLLPALASLLTLNRSDDAALWLFRLMSIAAFGGAAVVVFAGLRASAHQKTFAAVAAVACLVFDAKSLDFTINGMETGFLLLFIAGTLYAQFAPVERRSLWLGLNWAGLMWTRPDSFLYIGLLAAGAWIFNARSETGLTRGQWIRTFLAAGLVCTAVYLPWFLGSWWYYGTPIPHTIVAKSALTRDRTVWGALEAMVTLPVRIWTKDTSLPGAFLPAYFVIGGWPSVLQSIAKVLAFAAAFAWVVPVLGTAVRTASFGFFGFQVYLTYFPYFPFPWYQPGAALLGSYALCGMAGRLWTSGERRRESADSQTPRRHRRGYIYKLCAIGALALVVTLLGMHLWVTPAVARQFAAQQDLIENQNRRKIGEWLREQAKPGDTVFLEPLGYIGYFSNLKTYDFPGMSNREIPRAVRDIGTDWVLLIEETQPTWLVLRPSEILRLTPNRPSLFTSYYHPVKTFDVTAQVQKRDVRGRRLLEIDARFEVFRREDFNTYETEIGRAHAKFEPGIQDIAGKRMVMVHAPSEVLVPVPASARSVTLTCGFVPGAGKEDPKSDGVSFNLRLRDRGHTALLGWHVIDPRIGADPHTYVYEVELPPHSSDAELVLQADPGAHSVKDWSCWSAPVFK